MDKKNKKIVFNTGVMYARLIITTVIGLFTSRYLLQALGASDFGLYAVVGGLIAMLNVLSTAMSTTTRRFINVEMGKVDGNLNKIFNISRLLHIGFAIFIIIIAETIGLFYIYHFLNVEPGKIGDAVFVFQVSVLAAAVGIYTVPYQSLLEANEKFTIVALLDILRIALGLGLVLSLFLFSDYLIRIYSIGMCCITLILLLSFVLICRYKFKDVIRFKYYSDKKSYKEIFIFNNYVALGATSYLSRSQVSTMLVNYFFGTLTNAAFAIGYSMETYCISFVTNIGTAAAPQITSNYENNNERSLQLTASLHRISSYMMILLIVPLSLELGYVLNIWLKEVPEGALMICHLTLLSALFRVVFGGTDKFIQASGKIKWFQIISSLLELLCIPISFLLFHLGFAPYTIIIVYIISSLLCCISTFFLMKRLLGFNVGSYMKMVYKPVGMVIICVAIYVVLYCCLPIYSSVIKLFGIFFSIIIVAIIVYFVGMNEKEKGLVKDFVSKLTK